MRPTTVLLIDDDVLSLEVIGAALEARGHKVVTVSDPELAIDVATELNPDFVVIDIVMPKKSGLELCHEFKTNPRTRQLPIMFLSSSEDPGHIIASLHLGCVDFLQKPMRAEDLDAVIRKHDMISQIAGCWEPAKKELQRVIDKYRTPIKEAI